MTAEPADRQPGRWRLVRTTLWISAGWCLLSWLVYSHRDAFRQAWQSNIRADAFLLAIGLFGSSQICMSLRWRCFLRQQGCEAPFPTISLITVVAMLSNYLAVGQYAGAATRVVLHSRWFDARKSQAVAGVLLDRLTGVATFIVTGLIGALVIGVQPDQYRSVLIGLTVFFLGLVAVMLVAVNVRRSEKFRRWTQTRPRLDLLRQLLIENTQRPRFLVEAVFWSFLSQALATGALSATAAAFPPSGWQPGFWEHLTMLPAVEVLASVVPTPAGIGVKELGLILLYKRFATLPAPADPEQLGLMVAVANRVAGLLSALTAFILFGGLVWLQNRKSRLSHATSES